jgi:hypothetical protein
MPWRKKMTKKEELARVKNDLENARFVFRHEMHKYAMRIDMLRTAIDVAKNELGVPHAGYPSNVTNAYRILDNALYLERIDPNTILDSTQEEAFTNEGGN